MEGSPTSPTTLRVGLVGLTKLGRACCGPIAARVQASDTLLGPGPMRPGLAAVEAGVMTRLMYDMGVPPVHKTTQKGADLWT
jgi:hypothetical protein